MHRQSPCFWSLLLLFFCLSSQALGDDEREQLQDQMSKMLQRITQAQLDFTKAVVEAQISLSPTIISKMQSFKDQAKKWQQNVDDVTQNVATEQIDQFGKEWSQFNQRLSMARNFAGFVSMITERLPDLVITPELQRYRAFEKDRIERLLDDSINPEIESDYEHQTLVQRHHKLLLCAIDGVHNHEQRWELVPPNASTLTEYRDHCRFLVAAIEHAIVHGPLCDESKIDRDESIFSLLEDLVQTEQERREQIAHGNLPNTSPAIKAFTNCQEREAADLRALIAHQRTVITDEESWNEEEKKLRDKRLRHKEFSDNAQDWLKLAVDFSEMANNPNIGVKLTMLSESNRTELGKQLTAINATISLHETTFAHALEQENHLAALRAKGELKIAIWEYGEFEKDLSYQHEYAITVTALRAKFSDPKIAELLVKIDALNAAFYPAMKERHDLELTRLRSELTIYIATIEAQTATKSLELIGHAALEILEEQHRLVEEATNLIGKMPQKPMPEPKPPF